MNRHDHDSKKETRKSATVFAQDRSLGHSTWPNSHLLVCREVHRARSLRGKRFASKLASLVLVANEIFFDLIRLH